MRTKFFILLAVFALAGSAMLVTAARPAGGSITGKVTFTGTPPKMKPIDMSKEPYCQKLHNPPIKTQDVEAGPGDTLEDAVVFISTGDQGSSSASTPVRYDQKGCQYIPHVLAVHVNQEFKILNDDQTSHNIHPLAKVNNEWNLSQPPGSQPISKKYDKEEFIPVKCNIHPWMHGYFAVLKTSHYDVSKSGGDFKLPNLPPGKYTITAWHEGYGTQTADVTITGNESKDVNFTFTAKPY